MDSLLSGFVLKRRHTIKSCKRQKQYERYYMYHSRSSITRVSIRNTHLYLWINLADLLDTSGFVQHVSGATHVRGSTLNLIVTAKTYNLLTTPVSPTTLFTDYYALECDLNVVKPERPKRRVRYRKFASIDKRAFTADIRDAFAVTSGTTVESIDNYNTAIEAIVNKHAPVVTRVIADRPKTPWHTEVLSCAKRDFRRAERRWRKTRLTVHRQIYTTLRDEYRRKLAATKASHFCAVISEAGHNMNKSSASRMHCWADLYQLSYLRHLMT